MPLSLRMSGLVALTAVAAGLTSTAAMAQNANGSGSVSEPPNLLFPLSEKSFTRYAVPGECAWAEEWLENMYWRNHRPDTVFHTKAGHAYQSSTQETIKGCASRFTAVGVAERDLIGLAQAALGTGQLDKADAALARLTKGATTPAAKAWAEYQAVDVYLGAPLPQIQRAEGYITKLDAMGPDAAVERMLAHAELASEAQRRDSIPLWDKETQAALTASKAITGDTRKEYAFESGGVYIAIAELKARQNDVAGARATLTAGRTELVPLRPSVAGMFDQAETWYALQGQAPGPVQATKWIFKSTPGDTQPVRGKPAVIMFVSANCGGACYANYAVLRRLIAQFPANQLDVIFVTHTEGYSRGQLVSPDSDMAITEEYFTNFLSFPANVAMWKGVFSRRADQRLMMQPSPAQRAYNPPLARDITIGILDKTGVLRMYTTLNAHNEIMLDDIVKSVM